MTPEQREKLKQAADRIIDDGWYEERDKGMALDACASDYDFIFKANPAAILSLIAQVEALTVPHGWQLVPVEPTIEMIAALGYAGDEVLAVGHGLISKGIADDYAAMLAAAPTIPAILGTKEGA